MLMIRPFGLGKTNTVATGMPVRRPRDAGPIHRTYSELYFHCGGGGGGRAQRAHEDTYQVYMNGQTEMQGTLKPKDWSQSSNIVDKLIPGVLHRVWQPALQGLPESMGLGHTACPPQLM